MRSFFGKEKEKDVNMEKLQKEGKDIHRKTNRKILKNKRKQKKSKIYFTRVADVICFDKKI